MVPSFVSTGWYLCIYFLNYFFSFVSQSLRNGSPRLLCSFSSLACGGQTHLFFTAEKDLSQMLVSLQNDFCPPSRPLPCSRSSNEMLKVRAVMAFQHDLFLPWLLLLSGPFSRNLFVLTIMCLVELSELEWWGQFPALLVCFMFFWSAPL